MFFSNRHDTRIFNDTKLFFLSCKLSPVALYLYPFIYPSIHPPPKVNALTLACVKVQLWLFHPLKSTRNIFLYSISIHLYFLFLKNFIVIWKQDLITFSTTARWKNNLKRQVLATIQEESCFLYFCYCACFVFQSCFLSKTKWDSSSFHPIRTWFPNSIWHGLSPIASQE